MKSNFVIQSVTVFAGIPLFSWALGNVPMRSFLKDSLSVLTTLAFCQMIGLFFWSRANGYAVKDLKMSKLIKFHKIIGYSCITILFFHPFFLVVPRFFEAGVSPGDAFITIITTLNRGVVLGIIAWCLMLILGVTSLVHKKLPIKYTTWRIFHGILAVLFIAAATCHVIDLGRHSSLAMSIFITILTASGILLLLRTYTSKKTGKNGEI